MKYLLIIINLLLCFICINGESQGPVITPDGGLFTTGRLVTLNLKENSNASIIYYTLDGSNPLLSNNRLIYKTPFRITEGVTVKAIFIDKEGLKSNLSSAVFKKITRLEAPSIQQLTNSNSYAIFSEQKLETEGIELYYTTDNRDPSIFGNKYKGELFSKHGTRIKAVALHKQRQYLNSEVVEVVIDTTNQRANHEELVRQLLFNEPSNDENDTSSLEILWGNGEMAGDFLVSFFHPLKDINFIYTLDGSDPMPGATMWNRKAFTVKSPAHIKVRTYEIGMKLGPIKEKIFNPAQLSKPVSDIPSGTTFSGDLSLRLSVPGQDINNVEILYTLNGKDPLLEGKLYKTPVLISENCIVRALAQGAGFSTSGEVRLEYFHMIEVTSALFLDKNSDGFVETARLTLSSPATNKPPEITFIDPSNNSEIRVLAKDITLNNNKDVLNINFSKRLGCGVDFSPGHFGSISVPGEYSTTPFLVYGEGSTLSLEVSRQLNINITNNPFIPDVTKLPENLQEISDFSYTTGAAIAVHPSKPAFGYGTIFDALGNIILSKREMVEDDNGGLYLFWDGKDNSSQIVSCGNYLIIVSTEEKINGVNSQGRAFISVKCP